MDLNPHMKLALDLSKEALPNCLPNPPVGAVITHRNKVVGYGHTQKHGGKHAEIMAIESVNEIPLNECEIFVTLEPCSFYGKTPPCVDRLIQSKFRKVYIGIIDPHSRNNGKGLSLLKENNIPTEVGILSEEIHAFLDRYLWSTK
ncbi:hypothetical protein D6445_23575 [Salmonella enterica subsp. enterica serovar Infantis]|nr:hypothetical protein [Salmonella enterica subsp. enterica serovar Infantis]EGI5923927.1 hypothetical protein [Salmonella enterica subsp. enterica serovar Colindale]